MYSKDGMVSKLALLDKCIEELQERMSKVKPAALLGAGRVFECQPPQPDYMWVDILVHTRLHQTLCCWASHLSRDFVAYRDFWGKVSFHISFSTAMEWV